MKIENTFEVGQWIMHSHHGIGQILSRVKKQLGNVEKDYFRVKISTGEYWLAMENVDSPRIRIISTEKIFMEALSMLQTRPESLPTDHRFRLSYIDDQIGTGTLSEQAALIRDIYGKQLEKSLSISEKERFDSMCRRFVDEWVIVMGISVEEANRKLEEALQQISKIAKLQGES